MHDEPGAPGHITPTAEGAGATVTQAAYAAGQVIEYTSFDPSGYSAGQVVGYAPADEQTRVCTNCNQLSVPGEPDENGLRACPRCQALCRFPALDPRVYIRARAGGKPFPVRESQLRPHQAARRPPRPETTSPVPLAPAARHPQTADHGAVMAGVPEVNRLWRGHDFLPPEEGQWLAYGYAQLASYPDGAEWGDISLTELERARVVRGLVQVLVERDLYWTPVPFWRTTARGMWGERLGQVRGQDAADAALADLPDWARRHGLTADSTAAARAMVLGRYARAAGRAAEPPGPEPDGP